MWWSDAVIYQIYPRSFQDSGGDGVGDLRGIASRLDHVASLGVSAIWLSPVYPSPQADFGYDVSDYRSIDPAYGTLEDFDALLAAAHSRGLKLLMDLVPCHTSIEHPWFEQHPDWYVWREGPSPPNNWRATFGGPAWTWHPGRGAWYLHSFYPEQPDLDWRNPEVVEAMKGVLRFWLDRGVDGFRLDAIDRLLKDAALRDDPPAAGPFALPLYEQYAELDHVNSTNAPDLGNALRALREAAGDAFLAGEVYLPTAGLAAYLDHLDAAFCFELLHAPFAAGPLRAVLEEALAGDGIAWVLSNHDFTRVATRFGEARARLAALLLLTLPGPVFVYAGDEIGMVDGPGGDPPFDRAGRDGARHPMQWDGSANGGFTAGRPWLPAVDPQVRNVAAQGGDPGSMLELYRSAIGLRRVLTGAPRFLEAGPGVLAFERNSHLIALNLGEDPSPLPGHGSPVLTTGPAGDPAVLPPLTGIVLEH